MQNTKIEWTGKVWNPVSGCYHNCDYCYARRMANRLRGRFGYPEDEPFRPTFHRDRIDEPSKLRKPTKIFVCSMGELFGEWVEDDWIDEVFHVVHENPQHTFQFLTKNPKRYLDRNNLYPRNVWLGVSVENNDNLWRIEYLKSLINVSVKFVSFEPLLTPIYPNLRNINWVLIGALTGPHGFKPSQSWIDYIEVEAGNSGAKIFEKNNLYNNDRKLIQEFPD